MGFVPPCDGVEYLWAIRSNHRDPILWTSKENLPGNEMKLDMEISSSNLGKIKYHETKGIVYEIKNLQHRGSIDKELR